LAYAVPFARQFGAELVLLHVVVPYPSMPEMGPVDAETVQEAGASMARMVEQLPEGVCSNSRLVTGMADVQIVREADRCDADLIIIATHGRSGLARVLLGSTAERVVRHAHCPVLVVREQEHGFLVGEKSNHDEERTLPSGG
jgi:nucleotide-binding universal stress UspA family protein